LARVPKFEISIYRTPNAHWGTTGTPKIGVS
jgi:hypothetical protein